MSGAKELLLIYPRLNYPSGDVPLGVLYLAAAARAKLGIQPEIMDLSFSKNPLAEIKSRLSENNYQWIGISAMVTMANSALEVAKLVRQIRPQSKIILGGPHATTLPEKCVSGPYNFLALGESEETLVELIQKGGGEDVAGIWFSKDGEWIKNPPRLPVENLDQIPFPAFDIIDLEQYKRLWFQLDTIGRPVEGTSILATRGCPYQCSFCQPTLERLFGRKLRKRSPDNILAELLWLKERFKIQGFIFLDDTLIVDRKWTTELADKIVGAKLGLVFGCNMRAELVDDQILGALKEAGLRKIYLGIESCTDRIREEVLNKKITRDEIQKAVLAAKRHGIKVQGYFMIGAPGETKAEAKKTVAYARELDLDDLTINITTPLPGTFLHQKYRGDIFLEEEDFDYYRRYAFKPGELSETWLRREQVLGYLAFYIRPRKLLELVRSIFLPRFLRRTFLKLKRVF